MEDRPRDDTLEELLGEIRALRREIRGIREALERLAPQAVTRVSDAPGGEATLSSGEEAATGVAALPRTGPDTAAARAGPTVWQRFYRRIHSRKERLRYAFPLQKIVTVLAIFLVIYGISAIGIFDWVEILFSNVRYAFKGEALPSKRIALVVVDTPSIQELGPYGKSWRRYHGQVLKHLADDGIRAVGFDFSFSSTSKYDQAFIEGIDYARKKGAAVVIANQYDASSRTFSSTTGPIRDTVSAVGHAYLMKDRVTHLVRWAPLQLEEVRAQGPLRIRKSHLSLNAQLAGLQGAPRSTAHGDTNDLTIRFRGKKQPFKTYPYVQVFENRFPRGSFTGKTVLIGTTLPMHKDFYDVPGRSQMPGVEIHAHAVHTLLTGDIRKMGPTGLGIAIFILALVTGLVFAYNRPVFRIIGLPGLLALYWIAGIYYFLQKPPVELNLVYPSMSLVLTWGILSLQEKMATRREFTRTIGLPKDVVRRLEADPDFREGDVQRCLTVLESDIVNYSVFSNQNPAGHVRAIVAEYNAGIEKVIYKNGGYVNKYIGDAVLAIFGYPMEEKDSAKRAVRAAWEMQQVLAELVRKWKQENKNCFNRVRIGINHGDVSISYLGQSKKQLDVLGDNVDLAARLESEAGKHAGAALMSLSTFEAVKDLVIGKSVAVALKNRPDVKEAYTLEGIIV